jgi:ribonucleoside-triphosphate reductase
MNETERVLYVIKRDGRQEEFDCNKITNAVIKAMTKIDKIDELDIAYEITNDAMDLIYNNYNDVVDIHDIERIVETVIMRYDPDVAREYTSYRGARDASRMRSSRLVDKINGLLNYTDPEIIAENANKAADKLYVQRDLLAGTVAKEITKDLRLIPDRVQLYRDLNYIHWHDEDYSPLFQMYNCMLIDYRTMLSKGFIVGNALIESPKSFGVACTHLSQIIQGVACSQYGGQTINRIDEGLVPYVVKSYRKVVAETLTDYFAKEKMEFKAETFDPYDSIDEINNYLMNDLLPIYIGDDKETLELIRGICMKKIEKLIYDGIQCLEYQVNTLFTTNGQTPFVSISFGLGTSIESRMIQTAILEVRMKGIGKNGATPVFPKLLFILCKGINFFKTDPNYDIKKMAMRCASQRMYPDILCYDNVCKIASGEVVYKDAEHKVVDIEKSTGFKAPMGCRSFLHRWTNPETGKEEYDGRNNCGVISVNLVKIALEARNDSTTIKGREKYFFEKLNEVLDVAHQGLKFRAESLLKIKAKVSPILYGDSTVGAYGATGASLHPEEEVGKLFINKRASVSLGYVGLHETVLALYGQKMFGNPEMIEKGVNIMKVLQGATKAWSANETWAYSVYSTPAENLMNKFIGPDTEMFGEVEGITDKDWYTNSCHLDVQQPATAFEKIDFEGNFSQYTPGGVTCMIDCNSLKNNPYALEPLWDYVYDSKISYASINVKEDRCYACGFVGEHIPTDDGYKCPCCGNTDPTKQQVIRRISGYLTDASSRPINHSKKSEIDNRVVHY